ncbi:MAG TPA: threonine/serine exporter family protein [Bacillota bacterium]|nr:threonine/serine exporter family protein [Clostridiales bacterium]HPT85345.1 threonine/serine exporter family protein [Bacillota bacterium]
MEKDTVLLTEVLGLAGMLILENGGDTHRAEETAERICAAAGRPGSDVLALPTGIMITISPYCGKKDVPGACVGDCAGCARPAIACEGAEEPPVSLIRRVKKRTINLSKLERANRAARAFTDGKASLSETLSSLREIDAQPRRSIYLEAAYSALSCGLFSLLFGGGWFELLAAFVCGFLAQIVASALQKSSIFQFASSFIGAVVIASLAALFVSFTGLGNINIIITGSLMNLLPGLAMTNAIRDTMTGDLVSGVARFADVLLIAMSLAGGVGIVLSVFISLGGTVR